MLATYSITDERRADRRPDRAVLRDRPAGAGRRRQRHHRHRRPQGRGGLLGDRLHVAGERRGRRCHRGAGRHLLRVRRGRAQRLRRGDVDRRRDPARLGGAERGRAEGRRRAVLRGAHRRRLQPGLPRDVPVDQRRADRGLRQWRLGRRVRGDARVARTSRRRSPRPSTSAPPDRSSTGGGGRAAPPPPPDPEGRPRCKPSSTTGSWCLRLRLHDLAVPDRRRAVAGVRHPAGCDAGRTHRRAAPGPPRST